jgi:hypothetical protein
MPVLQHFSAADARLISGGIRAGGRREAGGRLRPARQQKMLICRLFLAGATGLEPATSGVTGLFHEDDDRRRLRRNRSIDAGLRAVRADLRTIEQT